MLQIEISRQPDAAVVIRCTRDDGSVTWQKQTRHAAHFVLHDLTHYAVETVLDYRRGSPRLALPPMVRRAPGEKLQLRFGARLG
jgi:hypothetical protein